MTMAQHNLRTVIAFEVRRTLSKRRFWISTLIVPVAFGVVFALVALSNSSTDNSANAQKNAKFDFSYVDASGMIDPAIASKAGGTPTDDPAGAIAKVKAGDLDAFFSYPADPAKQAIRVYGQDKG